MIEFEVVAAFDRFRRGDRVILHPEDPLARISYLRKVSKEENDVVSADVTADPAGVLPESKKRVTRGKSRLESGSESESGTPERDRGSSESSGTVSSRNEGPGAGR